MSHLKSENVCRLASFQKNFPSSPPSATMINSCHARGEPGNEACADCSGGKLLEQCTQLHWRDQSRGLHEKECYNYETLGGNHSRAALQALCKEETTPHAAFRTRLVSVYSGLTDEEAQRLASRHNHTTSLQHKMSSWEKVQHACMQWLSSS